MGKTLPSDGKPLPPSAPSAALAADGRGDWRHARPTCLVSRHLCRDSRLHPALRLQREGRRAADEPLLPQRRSLRATHVDPSAGPIADQIQRRVDAVVRGLAMDSLRRRARDGDRARRRRPDRSTRAGGGIPTPMPGDPIAEAARLLPASADVVVSVPHDSLVANAILVSYAAALIYTLFLYDRRRQRDVEMPHRRKRSPIAKRPPRAPREIEAELAALSQQVDDRVEAEVSDEMASVRAERVALQQKLEALARRESELRSQAGRLQEALVTRARRPRGDARRGARRSGTQGRGGARARGEAEDARPSRRSPPRRAIATSTCSPSACERSTRTSSSTTTRSAISSRCATSR